MIVRTRGVSYVQWEKTFLRQYHKSLNAKQTANAPDFYHQPVMASRLQQMYNSNQPQVVKVNLCPSLKSFYVYVEAFLRTGQTVRQIWGIYETKVSYLVQDHDDRTSFERAKGASITSLKYWKHIRQLRRVVIPKEAEICPSVPTYHWWNGAEQYAVRAGRNQRTVS